MPTLRITIKMDNQAFHDDDNGTEVSRMLYKLADKLHGYEWHPGDSHKLIDSNGNTVGEAKVTR